MTQPVNSRRRPGYRNRPVQQPGGRPAVRTTTGPEPGLLHGWVLCAAAAVGALSMVVGPVATPMRHQSIGHRWPAATPGTTAQSAPTALRQVAAP
jgi:hypothetical protein